MSVIVVIPAFDEQASIYDVVRGVRDAGFEVVVVDDGSTDATRRRARSAGATVLRHLVNRGYGAALTTGSRWAVENDYSVVVHFDADGQHDPAEIQDLVEPIRSGAADVAIGSRFLGSGRSMPWTRALAIKSAIQFTRLLSGVTLTDAHNGFRAFSSAALGSLECREDGMAYASEIVEKVSLRGLRLREVPVTITYSDYSKAKGESNLTKLRVGLRFIWAKLIH